jgi:hypothetical protein
MLSSLRDDEVGGPRSAIRAERAQRVRQSNCVKFHEPSPTTLAPHPRPRPQSDQDPAVTGLPRYDR